jgi:hypothetical protein
MYIFTKLYPFWDRLTSTTKSNEDEDSKPLVSQEYPKVLMAPHPSPSDSKYALYLVWVNGRNQQFQYSRIAPDTSQVTIQEEYTFHKFVPLWSTVPRWIHPYILYYHMLPRTRTLCPYLTPKNE